ncbi:unnamed protein product, partial [Choristocarpus tenellus]
MGIKNLWQLLSPIGRSVSIETLEGKTLAVDVSIWLTQFIKAMRDDDGKVVKNAHIIGTLRRVVKLLFHRIRPVFVFDGGAPALKSRTLAARRKLRREGTEESVRKTAQRILAAQLKKHKALLKSQERRYTGGSDKDAAADAGLASGFTPVHQQAARVHLEGEGEKRDVGGSNVDVEEGVMPQQGAATPAGDPPVDVDSDEDGIEW